MSDLKIPNMNKKSDKYIFKKSLTLRRKSKRKLIKESCLMLSFSILIIYVNYLIPEKKIVFDNFFSNFTKVMNPLMELTSYIYEIFIVIFIVISFIFAAILISGAFYRLLKIVKRKTKRIIYK